MQVLSATVAKAIRTTHSSEVEETVKFIENFDKFFDCLNVTNYDSGRKERTPFKEPYRSDDFRLKWLQDFIILSNGINLSNLELVTLTNKTKACC